MSDDIWYLAGMEEGKGFLKDDYQPIGVGDDGVELGPLNRINIFVGENNSGKSRLIRRIAQKGTYKQFCNQQQTQYRLVQKIISLVEELEPHIAVTIVVDGTNKSSDLRFSDINRIRDEIRNLDTSPNNTRTMRVDFGSILTKIRNLFVKPNLQFLKDPTNPNDVESQGEDISRDFNLELMAKQLEFLTVITGGGVLNQYYRMTGHKNTNLGDVTNLGPFDPLRVEELIRSIQIFRETQSAEIGTLPKIYIPVLRGVHRLIDEGGNVVNTEIYEKTISENYKDQLPPKEHIKVFTGQDLYTPIVIARNGDREEREMFYEFEKFLAEQFFGGRTIDIVAKIIKKETGGKDKLSLDEKKIVIHIKGDKDRELHDLGDGIQALIMLTFPIFMAEEGSFILMEEPELNLHPGMQRIFLEVISKNETIRKKNLTFFMTTHSNHFLDLTITEDAPVSIFTLKKNEESKRFEIRNVHSGHNEPLELLGVQNSSVYIANCSLWVEGPTDRRYIRKYLELYINEKDKKPFKEDLHYVFFLYGGILINNYSLDETTSSDDDKIRANRMNSRFMLVADKDDSPAKQELHALRDKLRSSGYDYATTDPAREIENLLSQEVLEEVLPKVFVKWLGKKSEEIAQLDPQKIQTKALLELLRDEIGTEGLKDSYSKATINSFNGTDKKAICDEALKVMTWKKMSLDAQKFAEKIYAFIEKQNTSQS